MNPFNATIEEPLDGYFRTPLSWHLFHLIYGFSTKSLHVRLRAKRAQQLPTSLRQQCCVRVGSGVQTDATTSNKFGTCSAS